MFKIYFFLIFFLSFNMSFGSSASSSSSSSSNQDENNSSSSEPQEINSLPDDFFKLNPCRFQENSLSDSPDLKQIFSCSIDVSMLKDKNIAKTFIENPQNWSKENIHPSLYEAYFPFKSNIKVSLLNDQLIVYSPIKNQILDKFLANSSSCSPIIDKDSLKSKIPSGEFLMNDCFIQINSSSLKQDAALADFLKEDLLNTIINEKDFKKQFILNLNTINSQKDPIYFIPFNFEKTRLDFIDFNKYPDYFNLEIIESSLSKDLSFKSYLFRALTSTSLFNLDKYSVHEDKVEYKTIVKCASIQVKTSLLKENGDYLDYMKASVVDSLINESEFKKQLVDKVNLIGTQGNFNLDKVILYTIGFHSTPSEGWFVIHLVELE